MNTAASEWAAYVAARNRIETAKAAHAAAAEGSKGARTARPQGGKEGK